jgi:putative N6-adenine-specific DNA methylase
LRFFASCAKGTEGPLRRELVGLRIHAPRGEAGGVSFDGTFEDAMKVCLWSRVAMRVLMEVAAYPAADAHGLYRGARAVDWPKYLDVRTTFAVSASVAGSTTLRHSGFAALKVKDAVADTLRDQVGARPDVAPADPDVAVFLHLRGSEARLFLDLAGEPLHRRGYRVAMTEAPLKETLAAAVLALGRADAALPFIDPMAGSGTLAIEHALSARRIAPGLHRRFGFERWPDTDGHLRRWEALKSVAARAGLPSAPAPIAARDHSPEAVAAARRNAEVAGVAADIEFAVAEIDELEPSAPGGIVCFNPPYGERMDIPAAELDVLYARTARTLRRMHGWAAVVLCGNPLFARAMDLKPAVSHRLWNGPLEVRLLRYDF